MENELRDSESEFDIFFQLNPEPTWLIDSETLAFLDINDSAIAKYGYTRKEFLGLTLTDILPSARKEDAQSLITKWINEPKKIHESVHRLKDGTIVQAELKSHALDHEGRNAVLVCIRSMNAGERNRMMVRDNDGLLHTMGSMAKIGAWEFDAATGKGTWTEEVARIHDMDPQRETDLEIGLSVYAPESRGRIERAIKKAIQQSEPYDLELEMITNKGNRKRVRTIGFPVMEGGRVVKVRGTFQDVSEIRETEKAMNHYRLLADHTQDIILFLNLADGKILEANGGAVKAYGYTRNELLSMSINDLRFSSETGLVQGQMSEADRAGIMFETFHRRKDGTTFPVEVNSQGIDLDGRRALVSVIRDISKRREAESEIRRHEQLLKLFVENSPAAIAMFDREMRYIVASHRYLLDYHIKDHDIIGRSHYDVFPEIPERWKEIHRRCLAGVIEKCEEDPFPRADGTLDWVKWEVHPWYEEAGQIGGIILFSEVITERKLEARALELNGLRLLGLINSAMDGIISIDESQKVILFNPAAEKIFGVSAQDMIGKSIDVLIPERFRENHPSLVETLGQSGTRSGPEETARIRIVTGLRANGEEFPMEASISQIEVEGKKVYTVVQRDVTEQVKARRELQDSEARYRKLYETAPVGISNVSPEGKFIRCNAALEKITGYSEQELQHMLVYDITHPDDREATEQLGRMLAQGKLTTGSLEKRYIRKDGQLIWIYLVSSGVYDAEGKFLYTISITQEITDRKISEEKVRRLNRVYAVLSEINQTLVRVGDIQKLFNAACRIAVEVGKFKLAWIGLVDEANENVKPAAFSGDAECFDVLDAYQSPNEAWRRGAIGKVILEKHHAVTNDMENGGMSIPWTDEGLKRGIKSFAAFPLMNGDRLHGVMSFYSSEVGFFDEQEVALLKELSSDISYSIANIELEDKHRELRKDRDRMFNYSVDMLSVAGFKWDLKQINPAWSKILGWTEAELMAKPVTEFIHPEDRELTREIAADLGRGTPVYSFENRCLCKDGSYKWLSWNCFPLVEDKMIFSVTRDITDQKKYSEQLLIRNAAVESAMSAIGFAELGGRVFFVNPAFLKLWGYHDVSEVIGRNVSEFSVSADKFQRAMKLMNSGRSFFGESEGIRKDGTVFDFEISANVVKSDKGEPICLMASFVDITERKNAEREIKLAYEGLKLSEAKYRSLFEQSKDAIMIAMADGSIMDVNPAGVELFGFDSKEELLSVNIVDLYVDPGERETLFRNLRREKYLKIEELKLKKKNGDTIIVNSTSTAVMDQSNKIISVLAFLRDITRQKNLEAQLIQAQKMESLGTLAGGIAHDFNNLLGIIMGYSSILSKENVGPEKIGVSAKAIQSAAARGSALVKQLLTFARKSEFVYQEVRINRIVAETMKLLTEVLPKSIDVLTNLGSDIPLVFADSTQIQQVLMNLCVNARDAMPNGGILEIRTTHLGGDSVASMFPTASPGRYVVLAVSDNGTGMTEEVKKRIFDPFFTTKGVGKGTGLGLALVHSIVTNHEGFVNVTTQPGMGTTFYVYLPVRGPRSRNAEPSEVTIEEAPGGKETILFIEDEDMLRNLLKSVVEAKGYTVLVAADGEEGISLFARRSNEIDVVISDLGLPKIPGVEVLKKIRAISPSAKLVAASGFIEPDVNVALQDMGVKHFVNKPYLLVDIIKTIREVIDEKK